MIKLVINVRKASVVRCEYRFKLGSLAVDYTSQYRYLGFTFGETLDYAVGVNELLTAGCRALGALVSKYFKLDGLDYETYTKPFDSNVTPIIEHGSGVWGFKEYDGLNRLQNRAIRSYLGTGKFTPISALTGEMGWIPLYVRTHCQMVKLWCRIVSMHKDRIPLRIFLWDSHFSGTHSDTWTTNVKSIMYGCGFNSKTSDGLSGRFIGEVVKGTLLQKHQNKWTVSIKSIPKLRTYTTLNIIYSVQPYLKTNISRQERSVIARLRCGVLPLHIGARMAP